MSGLGGFAPLPIRLGGSAELGWTAEQHARVCADLQAAIAVLPFAVLTFTKSGSTYTLHSYRGMNGLGSDDAPDLVDLGTGITSIEFPAEHTDHAETSDPVLLWHVEATVSGSSALFAAVQDQHYSSPNKCQVRTFNDAGTLVDAKVTVEIGQWTRRSRIADYDGAIDKQNCRTEVVPYAWTAYEDLTAGYGDGFTQARTGAIHAEKLAWSRQCGHALRTAEMITANSLPGTSWAALGDWVEIMKVRLSAEDTAHDARQRAAAKFRGAAGNSRTAIDAVIAEMLGPYLDAIYRNDSNTLDDPPTPTYWPAGVTGPASYALGGGVTWMSQRCHLIVAVHAPNDFTNPNFQRFMNIELMGELDRLLPAWGSAGWSVVDDGFDLDEDSLDLQGLT